MLAALDAGWAQSLEEKVVPVTVDNFVRAESDLYLGNMVKEGSLGKFVHRRDPASTDNRTVIRANRDTLYSAAVFDLEASPATITLPNSGPRLMSLQVIDEDHYISTIVYGAGSYPLERVKIGTRYCAAVVRTIIDPMDPTDLKQGQVIQDAIRVSQENRGTFEVPNWDQMSQKKIRDALLVLASTASDFKGAFGARGEVDSLRHLIGTALNWGENPNHDAVYRSITPGGNDGARVNRLVVKEVPADVFWSISVGNAKGPLESTEKNRYSINSLTVNKSDDGAIAIQFGGCDGRVANCLSIVPNWNYLIRLYRPRQELQDERWTFPPAQPVP